MTNPTAYFETKYSPQVKHLFQNEGYQLKNTVMPGEHKGGDKFRWRLAGQGIAQQRSDGKYTFMNAARDYVEASAVDYDAAEKIRVSDLTRMGPNEIDVAAKTGAMACGRRADQVITDTLHAILDANMTVLGAFTDDFGLTQAIYIKDAFDSVDVPNDGNRFCLIPPRWFNALLSYEEFASSDFTGPVLPWVEKGTKSAIARTWLGINWITKAAKWLPTSGTALVAGAANVGPLAGLGTEGYGYAWHKEALGAALINNGETKSEVNKLPDEPAHIAVNTFSMAAVAIEPTTIIRIKAKTATAVAVSD